MKILCGDWRSDSDLAVRTGEGGVIRGLVFPVSTFAFESISLAKVKRIVPLTMDTHLTIGSAFDWGLDAAAILGPLENIAVTFATGDVGDFLIVIELHDRRKALIAGFEHEIAPLLELDLDDGAMVFPGDGGAHRNRPQKAVATRRGEPSDTMGPLPRSPFSGPSIAERIVPDGAPSFGRRGSRFVR